MHCWSLWWPACHSAPVAGGREGGSSRKGYGTLREEAEILEREERKVEQRTNVQIGRGGSCREENAFPVTAFTLRSFLPFLGCSLGRKTTVPTAALGPATPELWLQREGLPALSQPHCHSPQAFRD